MPKDAVQMGFLGAVLGNGTTLKCCSAVPTRVEQLCSLRPRGSPSLDMHATLMHTCIYQKSSNVQNIICNIQKLKITQLPSIECCGILTYYRAMKTHYYLANHMDYPHNVQIKKKSVIPLLSSSKTRQNLLMVIKILI